MNATRAGHELRVFNDRASMDGAAADLIVHSLRSAVTERGTFSLALSGGSTPRGLYGLLAAPPYREIIDWKATHVFWADERGVPRDHEDSNYRLADDLFLSKVSMPQGHVHRIRGEDDPSSAASAYEDELRSFFGRGDFTFDLVLLGMGMDGHTASLFPGDPAVTENERFVVPVPAEGRRQARITLTLPAINGARAVLFLVAGAAKATMVKAILEGGGSTRYPAGLVRPAGGRLIWYLDSDSARQLRAAF